MENNRKFFDRSTQKRISILFLTWVGSTFRMIGDTLREISALIFIFVPLELWRDQSFKHLSLIEYAAGFAALIFLFGAGSEYTSAIAYRFKKDLEGADDNP